MGFGTMKTLFAIPLPSLFNRFCSFISRFQTTPPRQVEAEHLPGPWRAILGCSDIWGSLSTAHQLAQRKDYDCWNLLVENSSDRDAQKEAESTRTKVLFWRFVAGAESLLNEPPRRRHKSLFRFDSNATADLSRWTWRKRGFQIVGIWRYKSVNIL